MPMDAVQLGHRVVDVCPPHQVDLAALSLQRRGDAPTVTHQVVGHIVHIQAILVERVEAEEQGDVQGDDVDVQG